MNMWFQEFEQPPNIRANNYVLIAFCFHGVLLFSNDIPAHISKISHLSLSIYIYIHIYIYLYLYRKTHVANGFHLFIDMWAKYLTKKFCISHAGRCMGLVFGTSP